MQARPCRLTHPTPVPERCRLCWLFVNDERYRTHWSDDLKLICVHLQEATGEYRFCTTCQQKVAIPLHGCQKHGQCTTTTTLPEMACCMTCKDRDKWQDPVPVSTQI